MRMTWKGILTIVGFLVVLLFGGTVVYFSHQADLAVAKKDSEISTLKGEIFALKREVADLKRRVGEVENGVKKINMVASWYGPGFHGRRASDGFPFNQYAYTCAHKTLPLGTIVIIEYRGHRVPAVVTDRGPFISGRDIDLSLSLAQTLGFVERGVVNVTVYEFNTI